MRISVLSCVGLSLFVCAAQTPSTKAPQPIGGHYIATAYSQRGTTASGEDTHRHIVAADPTILPLGTRLKITRAGRYSGEYVVADTGRKIEGRRLDIYIPSTVACRKFGKKRVRVKVIQVGDNTQETTREADHAVKADVKADVQKNVVGNAATEDDWAAKHRAETKGTSDPSSAPTDKTAPANTADPK